MAARIRSFDWASTPLGPIDRWPQSLKTATGLLIASPVPIVMLWGPDGVMIYNDAYSVFAGGRHPQLLGSNVLEGWPEVAEFNANVMRVGLAGGSLGYKDQELTLYRNGRPEQVWMDLDYWPVPGEDGRPAGVIATVVETTERILADRRAAAEQERQRELLRQMPGFVAVLTGPDHTFEYVNEAYRKLSGDRLFIGRTVRDVFPDIGDQGFYDLLDTVFRTGESFTAQGLPVDLENGRRFVDLLYEPIRDPTGAITGIFVGGYDTTGSYETARALADSEARYRTLFDTIGSGFCIIEMKFDAAGKPCDYRIIEGNAAFAEMTGLHDANGKWVSDIAPGLEQHWFDLYGQVALTGDPIRFENPADIFGRWYDVQAMRVGEPEQRRVAILFNNITDRKRREARQAALLEVNDALRELIDPADIAHAASRVLGEALDVDRVGYGRIDTVHDTLLLERDWTPPGVQSLAGTTPLRNYGSFVDTLKEGDVVRIDDARLDPRTAAAANALEERSARAFVNIPIVEQGRLVAVFFVNSAAARAWTDDEVQLIDDVAERVRTASERARATQALRQNEARLRFLDDLNIEVAKHVDPDAVLATTTRMTGRHLHGSVCAYAEMDPDEDGLTIRGEWVAPGAISLIGHYRLADFGQRAVEDLSSGRPLIIRDVERELAAKDAEAFRSIGIAAVVCMPLVKDGRLTALMSIHDNVPRAWTDEDMATIREVAQRSWAHVERVRSAAESRESETRYRALFNAMDEGFCIIEFIDGPQGPDSDYIHVEANPAYAEQAGIPYVVGQKVRDMIGDEAQGWIDLYAGVLHTGKSIRFGRELEATGRWLELAAFRVEPAERRQVAVIFKDLTARKQAELALRESQAELVGLNAQLEVLLEGSKAERDRLWTLSEDMLARADYAGGLSAVNPAWTKLLGWSEHELLTNPYADIIDPDNVPATIAALEEMGRTGLPTRFENRILTRGGEWKPIGWTVSPEPGERHFIAIGRDLTEDKAREHELAAAHEALRQSQKMEAVGQLTGGIAHDFNNLLAGISGSLELLEKRIGEGRLNGLDRYIDAAQGASRRAASLTQRLLAFSRRQTLDPRPTDVNRLISGIEELIRRSVGPTVEVEVVGAGGLWTTRIDASQLENALLNLCINSRDAMAPDGGRLTIETANKWLDERAARDRDLPPGQYISLCVTDTGAGMTPEVQAQAFDPFFTTKPLGQGTGLGLSMIHGFVRQSGGQVRIYSELGEGTTMCLYLPRFMGEADTADAAQAPIGADDGCGETVLVIDDEPTVRMLVVEVLNEAGYTALEADDGPSGLAILQSDARIDLLITDVGLPGGMNGRQVADVARTVRPDLKVLFMTGYAENAAVGNGLLDAGMEVLTKPFAMAALGAKVREMIER